MKNKRFYFILSILLGFSLFYGITYCDDYPFYEDDYYNNDISTTEDYGFFFFMSFFRQFGWTFGQFYNINVFIIVLLIAVFLYRLNVNALVGMLLIVIVNYVQIANQISYFIAFPLFLFSVYSWHIKGHTKTGLALCLLSFLFHKGVIGLLIFHPLIYYIKKKHLSRKKIIFLFVLIGVFILLVFSMLSGYMVKMDEKFSYYTDAEMATLLGNLFMLLFPSFNIIITYYFQRRIDIYRDNESIVLFSLSMFPIIFMVATFSGMHIIVARYVYVFYVIWVVVLLKYIVIKWKAVFVALFLLVSFFIKNSLSIINYNKNIETNELVKIVLIWQSKEDAFKQLF